MLKAILVDVGNTLFDFKSSALMALERTAELYRIKLPDDILSIFLRHNNELWNEIEIRLLHFQSSKEFALAESLRMPE